MLLIKADNHPGSVLLVLTPNHEVEGDALDFRCCSRWMTHSGFVLLVLNSDLEAEGSTRDLRCWPKWMTHSGFVMLVPTSDLVTPQKNTATPTPKLEAQGAVGQISLKSREKPVGSVVVAWHHGSTNPMSFSTLSLPNGHLVAQGLFQTGI